jgi:FkbM family methyltransferase
MFEQIRGHTIDTSHLNSRSIIVDCGANKGGFSREMSDRFGGEYTLAEANPLLSEMLRSEKRFRVIHCAVSDREGTIPFNIAVNDEGSSILALPTQSTIECTLQKIVEVPTRKIEAILAETGSRQIDLLKIDIEGAEIQVLDSISAAALETIGQITVEFHCDSLFGFGMADDVSRVIARLRGLGFLCLDFSNDRRLDVLFINLGRYPLSWWRRKILEMKYFPPRWRRPLTRLAPHFVRGWLSKLLSFSERKKT